VEDATTLSWSSAAVSEWVLAYLWKLKDTAGLPLSPAIVSPRFTRSALLNVMQATLEAQLLCSSPASSGFI